MNDDSYKEFVLSEELRTSVRLIELGLGEVQNLRKSDSFHHLPFLLLSSGIERLLKCHICFGFIEQHGKLPTSKELQNYGGRSGHDLLELQKEIMNNYFRQSVPALVDDFYYLSSSNKLRTLLELLSEFGKYSRYYNLDIVTGREKPSRNVESEWNIFETEIALEHDGILNQLGDINTADYAIDFINRQVIIILETFVRAIARQYTIGQLGEKAKQHSSVLFFFLLMKDGELGNTNYRKETTRYKTQKIAPKKRTFVDKLKTKYNSKIVSKGVLQSEFNGDWPFYSDRITVECREGHWCIVTIEGMDYALNGSAQSRYKLEHVYDAGMAILGVSIYPFIKLCSELWKERNKL